MRPLALACLLVSLGAAADAPTVDLAAAERPREVAVRLASVPQAGEVSVALAVDLAPRLALDVGGWLSADPSQPTFLRGGWLGARVEVVSLPSIRMWVGARGLALQPSEGEALAAGLAADARTSLRVSSWLSLLPEFELAWVAPDAARESTALSRLSVTYRFHSGSWAIDALVGAQAWLRRDGALAPYAALAVDWVGRFEHAAVGLGGGVGLSRDGWSLVGHPLLREPTEVLQPWLFARLSVTPRLAW